MSIGEFARRSRLSANALRLYDELGLLPPARVDASSGYRYYGQQGAWALGKEFVALFRERPLPRMQGRAGAAFCIYWGKVSDDSDGPIEWCRPVPGDRAEALTAEFPELELRTEPAHREAFVHLGAAG